MWLACAKYHPTYGIPGTELHGSTIPEQIVYLGRGWEWWPTVLWQAIWTWIVSYAVMVIRCICSYVVLGGTVAYLESLGNS